MGQRGTFRTQIPPADRVKGDCREKWGIKADDFVKYNLKTNKNERSTIPKQRFGSNKNHKRTTATRRNPKWEKNPIILTPEGVKMATGSSRNGNRLSYLALSYLGKNH